MIVLKDKDLVKVRSARFFFSAEVVARIQKHAASARAVSCARCHQPLDVGADVVACPACGALHHQDGTLDCFTYAPGCATCLASTTLDGGFTFNPAEL